MSSARGSLIVVAAVALLVSGLERLVHADHGRRNLEIFTEMVYSRAAESFSASACLPGGTTQQPLVPGVVPRGPLPLHFDDGQEEAQRAGRELASPLSADDPGALEGGRRLYGIYCAVCHDPGGGGRGPAVLHGMLPPPSLHAERARQMADGEMFHILTHGQGNMAPMAAQLSRAERWQVIGHVRELQEAGQR